MSRLLSRRLILPRNIYSTTSLVARSILSRGNRLYSISHENEARSNDDSVSSALRNGAGSSSLLQAPVRIPHDPRGILRDGHPSSSILRNSSVVVHRQMAMMNVLMGFEEANRYVILDPQGAHIGYMAEREFGVGNAIGRQIFRTHRQFTTHIFDRTGGEVLRFHRPFSYISSTIRVYDPVNTSDARELPSTETTTSVTNHQVNLRPSLMAPEDMPLVGQASQQWAPLRRRYNLFLARSSSGDDTNSDLEDFAYIDSPFLAWDFTLRSTVNPTTIGSIDRSFMGLGRELFTDSGVYALRMDSAAVQEERNFRIQQAQGDAKNIELLHKNESAMTLDQRAVMLAMAVSVDYDYFSRDRGGFMFLPMPMGGPVGGAAGAGEAAGAGAAVGGVAEAGVAESVGSSAAGGLARGVGGAVAAEEVAGAAAGAGTLAGYEAMQRARENGNAQDGDANGKPGDYMGTTGPHDQSGREEVWNTDQDPYRQQQPHSTSQEDQMSKDDDDWDDWFGGGGGEKGGGESGDGGDGGGGDGGEGGGFLGSILDSLTD